MINGANDISVELSIPDGESDREKGGRIHRTSSRSKWPTFINIKKKWATFISEVRTKYCPPGKPLFYPVWDITLVLSSTIAVFVDPFYFYIPALNEDAKCSYFDQTLEFTYILLRTVFDSVYFIDILIFLCRRIRSKRNAFIKMVHLNIKPSPTEKSFKARIHQLPLLFGQYFLPMLPRIFVALPIPQIFVYYSREYWSIMILLVLIPIQYTLRIYRIYGLVKRLPNIETGGGRWLIAILDFIPFIFAAHLFGALWYCFAIGRELSCWADACSRNDAECDSKNSFICEDTVIYHKNVTYLSKSCPINPPDAAVFDFGIYLYAIQSNMTRSSTHLPQKISQSFWWGLRNLSSFGSNLQTSVYAGEIWFSVLTSICGIVLFMIYLNARVQVSQKIPDPRKLRQKIRMMNPDIDLWLYQNGISDHDHLKKVIMKNLREKFEENKSVDVENILSLLPSLEKRRIICHLGMASLKKVPMLESIEEDVLKAMCQHFKSVVYTEDTYIVRDGEPLKKMILIMQGTAWSYKPSTANYANIKSDSDSSSLIVESLTKGDFYGEELLNWATTLTSFSEFPNSTRIVKAQTKVEAFSIRADDLRSVVSKFWWYFSKKLGQTEESQLEKWQHLAASSIQTKWRRRHAITTKRSPRRFGSFFHPNKMAPPSCNHYEKKPQAKPQIMLVLILLGLSAYLLIK